MVRKTSFVLLLPLLLVMLPTVSAAPTSISGTFSTTAFHVTNTKTAGPNSFVTASQTFALTGSFSGSAVETATTLMTSQGLTVDVGSTRATFTGTFGDASGTIVFGITGNSAGGVFHGHFVILSGTGGLAHLRGEGTFAVTSMTGGTYSGHVSFQ